MIIQISICNISGFRVFTMQTWRVEPRPVDFYCFGPLGGSKWPIGNCNWLLRHHAFHILWCHQHSYLISMLMTSKDVVKYYAWRLHEQSGILKPKRNFQWVTLIHQVDQSGYGTVKVNCYFSCLVNTPNSEMLQISSNIPVPLAGGHGYSN
jgi:hypothetical protein